MIDTTYGLLKKISKKEMDHDEDFEDTWMNKKIEFLDYVKKIIYVKRLLTGDIVKGLNKLQDLD